VADTPDRVVDINAADDVFEMHLSARQAHIDIGPEVVKMLTYGAQLPGPEIRVQQGDRVIVHLHNELPDDFPTTIHWHGIEGTNAADGTPTTQGPVLPGERTWSWSRRARWATRSSCAGRTSPAAATACGWRATR